MLKYSFKDSEMVEMGEEMQGSKAHHIPVCIQYCRLGVFERWEGCHLFSYLFTKLLSTAVYSASCARDSVGISTSIVKALIPIIFFHIILCRKWESAYQTAHINASVDICDMPNQASLILTLQAFTLRTLKV